MGDIFCYNLWENAWHLGSSAMSAFLPFLSHKREESPDTIAAFMVLPASWLFITGEFKETTKNAHFVYLARTGSSLRCDFICPMIDESAFTEALRNHQEQEMTQTFLGNALEFLVITTTSKKVFSWKPPITPSKSGWSAPNSAFQNKFQFWALGGTGKVSFTVTDSKKAPGMGLTYWHAPCQKEAKSGSADQNCRAATSYCPSSHWGF